LLDGILVYCFDCTAIAAVFAIFAHLDCSSWSPLSDHAGVRPPLPPDSSVGKSLHHMAQLVEIHHWFWRLPQICIKRGE